MIMPARQKNNRVDLYTDNRGLDDLMLSECPIRFYPRQRQVIQTKDREVFRFSDFPRDELIKYLSSIDYNLGTAFYVLTLSGNKKSVIRIRKPGGEVISF